MSKQDFKVYGEEVILKDCKINIFIEDETGNKKQNTILYKGKLNKITPETEIGELYKIYVSYKDSHVNVLKFENIFRNASDQINHFYIDKRDDIISVMFVGREAEIKSKEGFTKILIPIDEYFKTQNITDEKLIAKEKSYFFNSY
jgi:hypothetical protein